MHSARFPVFLCGLRYNVGMKNLTSFAKKILKTMEPDESKWSYWMDDQELYPVSHTSAMDDFVNRMNIARKNQEKVFIGGDYDCDGICATTIMHSGLKAFGIQCGYYIPDRIREGYGLNEDMVQAAFQKGYTTIITVDNGVKAVNALNYAKELGMQTIVTDHHKIEADVPCDLLVHPDVLETHFHPLCGAGIAYECIRALQADAPLHLMLAAVASIGDVMPVIGETRALIQQGVRMINETQEPHIFALASDKKLNETSIAFQVVPKINAVGRLSNLGNVNNVVRYFLTDDRQTIRRFAMQVDDINKTRRRLSEQMCKFSEQKCSPGDPVILINDPSFHEGIIGLVANSLCAKYEKPAIIMTQNQEGLKASMRSPSGFDCMDFLNGFDGYEAIGGHKHAAGFSTLLKDYDAFRRFVRAKSFRYEWQPEPLQAISIQPEECTIANVRSLDVLRPFGPGFECPLFEIDEPQIQSIYDIQNGKHRRYTLENGLECMNFNMPEKDKVTSLNRIKSLIGQAQIGQYRGQDQMTFVIDSIIYH